MMILPEHHFVITPDTLVSVLANSIRECHEFVEQNKDSADPSVRDIVIEKKAVAQAFQRIVDEYDPTRTADSLGMVEIDDDGNMTRVED